MEAVDEEIVGVDVDQCRVHGIDLDSQIAKKTGGTGQFYHPNCTKNLDRFTSATK